MSFVCILTQEGLSNSKVERIRKDFQGGTRYFILRHSYIYKWESHKSHIGFVSAGTILNFEYRFSESCHYVLHAPNLRSVSFALTSPVPLSMSIRPGRSITSTTMINTATVTNTVATEIRKIYSSNRKELEGDVVYAYMRHIWEGLQQ